MGRWISRWNFSKSTYAPGDSASVSFWLENTGDTHLHLSDLQMQFDFGTYNLESVSGMVPPRTNKLLGRVNLLLPKDVVGQKAFTLKYRMYEYISDTWVDLHFYQPTNQYLVGIYPTPLYRVFLSRGLRMEDRVVGDPMAEMVREWGFETVTVDIEVHAPENQVPGKVREHIKKSDAVIAIATPRFVDGLTGLWRTLEWCHAEVGIAFGIDKPLLILKDTRVSLGGLPSYLADPGHTPVIEFDPYNLDELRPRLSAIMPPFRDWIGTKRRREFLDAVGKIAVGGLAVVGAIAIINGITGSASGTSKN